MSSNQGEKRIINKVVARMVRMNMVRSNRRWTPEEIRGLKKMYRNTVNRLIADNLERSIASVRAKASELGLSKNKTFMSKVAKLKGKRHYAIGA